MSMNFVGDIMLGRRFICQESFGEDYIANEPLQDCSTAINVWCPDSPGILTIEGSTFISNPIRELIQNSDISNANLETVITDNLSTPNPDKIFFHSCPNQIIPLLNDLGLDVLDLANNHIFDYLVSGMNDTEEYLDQNGFIYFGSGSNESEACNPNFLDFNGINIAYLGGCDREGFNMQADQDNPGFCWLDQSNVVSQIENSATADIIIYQMHSGAEYSTEPRLDIENGGEDENYNPFATEPSREDRELRQFTMDEGADIVVCHHPHVLQGLELYNEKLIAHSLGNFIFDQRFPETYPSIILNTILDSNGFFEFSVVPIYLYSYIPQRAFNNLGNHILDYMAMKSRELDTYLYVDRHSQVGNIMNSEPNHNHNYFRMIEMQDFEDNFYNSKPEELQKIGSIVEFSTESNIEYRVGREILWRGDFEFNPLGLTEFNESEHPYLLFWDISNSNENQIENIVASDSYTGDYSLMHFNNNSGSKIYSQINNCFPIDNNYEYIAKGYIKTENANDAKFGIRYYSSRANNCSGYESSEDEYILPVSGTTDWTEKYFNMNLPDDTDYIDFRFESGDGDLAYSYFDDLEIIQWEDWQNINESVDMYPNDYYYVQFRSSFPETVNIEFNELSYQALSYMLGDTNFDGTVNILDIVVIVNYIMGNIDFSEIELQAANYNGDNVINILDVVQIINEILYE